MVVYGHQGIPPVDLSPTLGSIAGDAMTYLLEAPQLFDVDVQQVTGILALVPLHGFVRPQIAQPRQLCSTQNMADRRFGGANV